MTHNQEYEQEPPDFVIPTQHSVVAKPETDPETVINYPERIERWFRSIFRHVNLDTGLFPAVDPDIKTPESAENHMLHAWIRDTAVIYVYTLKAATTLEQIEPGSPVAVEMKEAVQTNLGRLLNYLNQWNWLETFSQKIIEKDGHTELSREAPPMHMEQNGKMCRWDNNQPEVWGELLIAAGQAKDAGLNYSKDQTNVIRAMTQYLINIKPATFAGAGMWEGVPTHSPACRSNALAIAKGLDAVGAIFATPEEFVFYTNIKNTLKDCMEFVRQDANNDRTTPEGHPDGADLAMLAAMALSDSKKTEVSFLQYIKDNAEKLQIGSLPGVIRYINDSYYKGELGEARWFMGNPILAIGYFREAKKFCQSGDLEQAKFFQSIAQARLNQALEISHKFGHDQNLFPELFIQRDPKLLNTDPELIAKKSDILIYTENGKTVALQPLKRSLLWNSALMMVAAAEAAVLEKMLKGAKPNSKIQTNIYQA